MQKAWRGKKGNFHDTVYENQFRDNRPGEDIFTKPSKKNPGVGEGLSQLRG